MSRSAALAYPRPGTNAERVLDHIKANPGVTTNGLITKLDMNSTIVRKCLKSLLSSGKIEDAFDKTNGFHHYTAVQGRTL